MAGSLYPCRPLRSRGWHPHAHATSCTRRTAHPPRASKTNQRAQQNLLHDTLFITGASPGQPPMSRCGLAAAGQPVSGLTGSPPALALWPPLCVCWRLHEKVRVCLLSLVCACSGLPPCAPSLVALALARSSHPPPLLALLPVFFLLSRCGVF